jgi:trimethylamine:corrinoid methyltransferase-like protein
MSESPNRVISSSSHFGRLSVQQCEQLHDATLQVLERTGLIMEHPEALDLLRRAGAVVDGSRVRLPRRLVESALDTARKTVSLYDRNGREALTSALALTACIASTTVRRRGGGQCSRTSWRRSS